MIHRILKVCYRSTFNYYHKLIFTFNDTSNIFFLLFQINQIILYAKSNIFIMRCFSDETACPLFLAITVSVISNHSIAMYKHPYFFYLFDDRRSVTREIQHVDRIK